MEGRMVPGKLVGRMGRMVGRMEEQQMKVGRMEEQQMKVGRMEVQL